MKFITLLMLAIFSLPTVADVKADKAAFKKHYKAFNSSYDAGNPRRAYYNIKKAYNTALKFMEPESETIAMLAFDFAILEKNGEQAQGLLRKVLRIYKKIHGDDYKGLIDVYIELGNKSFDTPNKYKIDNYFIKARKISDKEYGENSILSAKYSLKIAASFIQHGYVRNAKRYLSQAHKTFSEKNATVALAETDFWYGKYFIAKRQYKESIKNLTNALNLYTDKAPNASITLTTHAFMVHAYEKMGERELATKHCQQIGKLSPKKSDQKYMPVYLVKPKYPSGALMANREGFALVSLTVTEEGFVENIKFIEGNKVFKKSSFEAAKQFRYAPQFKKGKPVKTENVVYRFNYKISS